MRKFILTTILTHSPVHNIVLEDSNFDGKWSFLCRRRQSYPAEQNVEIPHPHIFTLDLHESQKSYLPLMKQRKSGKLSCPIVINSYM